MIPENTPEQPLPPRRLVQLPNNLGGTCQDQNGELEKKKEDKREEEFVSFFWCFFWCKTPPPFTTFPPNITGHS